MFAPALLALLLGAAMPALAQPTPRDLERAERDADARRRAAEEAATEARRRAEEEVRLAGLRVEAAQALAEAEEEVEAARARLAAAEERRAAAGTAFARRAEALRPLLPAMLRLSLWPTETVLAVPAEPEETLRGALVLRGLVRRLEEQAASLRAAEAEAARAAAETAAEAEALGQAEARAREAADTLEAQLEEARQRRAAADEREDRTAERAQSAAAQARDLAGVLRQLEAARARREAEERANAAARAAAEARRLAERARARQLAAAARERQEAEEDRERRSERASAGRKPAEPRPQQGVEAAAPVAPSGRRAMPVAGRVVTGWGEATPGGRHRGLTFAAGPGARVVSPCGGIAVYAAPFRSFGLLLIVDCGGGYHFVLAGLDRLDATAGQRLLAGEPIGVLGGAGGAGASLYVELRRNGRPVDPRPWFAARG